MAALLAIAAAAAQAQGDAVPPIEPGDILEFDLYEDSEPARRLTVEPDGMIDVPLLGAVPLAGVSLRDARAALGRRFVEEGLLASPRVGLTIAQRRDVLVLGDVAQPGAVPWRATLTVEQAVGLARGMAMAPVNLENRLLTRAALQSDLARAGADIAREAAWAARLAARLAGRMEIAPEDVPQDAAPHLDRTFLESLLSLEGRILDTQAQTLSALRAARIDELAATEREISLLEERRENQNAMMDFAREEADRIQSLVDRGLSVAAESSRVGRMLVAEQSVQLGILAQLSQARSRLSAQRAELARLDGGWREQTLTELQERRVAIAALIGNRQAIARQLALVDDLMIREGLPGVAPTVAYRVRRSGATGGELEDVDALAVLRPGDIVFVIASAEPPAAGSGLAPASVVSPAPAPAAVASGGAEDAS